MSGDFLPGSSPGPSTLSTRCPPCRWHSRNRLWIPGWEQPPSSASGRSSSTRQLRPQTRGTRAESLRTTGRSPTEGPDAERSGRPSPRCGGRSGRRQVAAGLRRGRVKKRQLCKAGLWHRVHLAAGWWGWRGWVCVFCLVLFLPAMCHFGGGETFNNAPSRSSQSVSHRAEPQRPAVPSPRQSPAARGRGPAEGSGGPGQAAALPALGRVPRSPRARFCAPPRSSSVGRRSEAIGAMRTPQQPRSERGDARPNPPPASGSSSGSSSAPGRAPKALL